MKTTIDERPKPVNGTVGDARCTFTGKLVEDLVKLNQEVFDMQCVLRCGGPTAKKESEE